MMSPGGTVIFQAQSLFRTKSRGNFSLVRNPLDPLRASPHAGKEINLISYMTERKVWSSP